MRVLFLSVALLFTAPAILLGCTREPFELEDNDEKQRDPLEEMSAAAFFVPETNEIHFIAGPGLVKVRDIVLEGGEPVNMAYVHFWGDADEVATMSLDVEFSLFESPLRFAINRIPPKQSNHQRLQSFHSPAEDFFITFTALEIPTAEGQEGTFTLRYHGTLSYGDEEEPEFVSYSSDQHAEGVIFYDVPPEKVDPDDDPVEDVVEGNGEDT